MGIVDSEDVPACGRLRGGLSGAALAASGSGGSGTGSGPGVGGIIAPAGLCGSAGGVLGGAGVACQVGGTARLPVVGGSQLPLPAETRQGRTTRPGRAQNVRTGRMIRLRRVAFLLPSALSE